MPLWRVLALGFGYFALVFGAGFALGAVRVVLLQPYFGASLSRLLELPVMIVISYLAARALTRRAGPASRDAWLKVGLLAFILLMIAEALLGILVFRTPVPALLADVLTFTGALSLLAQALIILLPALAAGWDRTRS
jgi:heme A synthase